MAPRPGSFGGALSCKQQKGGIQAQHQVEGLLLLDVVVRQGARVLAREVLEEDLYAAVGL